MLGLFTKLWAMKEIIGVLLVVTVLLITGAYIKGKSDQSALNKAKQNEQRLNDVKKANKIRDKANSTPDADLNDALSEWLRD